MSGHEYRIPGQRRSQQERDDMIFDAADPTPEDDLNTKVATDVAEERYPDKGPGFRAAITAFGVLALDEVREIVDGQV